MVRSLVALLGIAALALGASDIVPGAFIIEISSSGLQQRSGGSFVEQPLNVLLANIANAGLPYSIRQKYTDQPDLFHGASLDVDPSTSAADLLLVPGVKRVWPVHRRARPVTPRASDGVDGGSLGTSTGVPITSAALMAGVKGASDIHTRAVKALTRVTKPVAGNYSTDNFAPHRMTGVDVTHKAGQLGSGQLVCMLDTGVDYKNPILGGCFGPGCHVSVGYDLVGDAYDGSTTPVPDADPSGYTDCTSHGTHVSGIVGALANPYGFSGVAPEANLGMFRIFGCFDSTTDDIILQAYLMAIKASCTVINISVGGPTGFESGSPIERMIETAVGQGIFTAVSAGNQGTEGLFFASDPASNLGGVSIAAMNSLELTSLNATVIGFPDVRYLGLTRFNISLDGHPVYFTSTDPLVIGDACDSFTDSTPDLANYIVVVQRGICLFTTKYQNVADKGGKYLIIYNQINATSEIYPDFTNGNPGLYAVAGMPRLDGLALLNDFTSSKGKLEMKFTKSGLTTVPNVTGGGLVFDFSSYATTFDMHGVNFGAPGGNILSTLTLADGGIGVYLGTSMSSPFVAGAAAVIMGARKSDGLSVPQIKSLLSTTAAPVRSTQYDTSDLSTVAVQGSGLIQVNIALATQTYLDPIQLILNDSAHLSNVQTLKITNKGSLPMLYTLSNLVAQGRGLYNATGDVLPAPLPPVVAAARATVSFSQTRVQVSPGSTVSIKVTVTPPSLSASDTSLFPTYSGWVVLNGVQQHGVAPRLETLRVPYYGLSGSSRCAEVTTSGGRSLQLANSSPTCPVLDTTDTTLGPGSAYLFLMKNGVVQLRSATYSYPTGPTLFYRLAMGSAQITIDLVQAPINLNRTIPTQNNPAALASSKRVLFSSIPTLGNLYTDTISPRDAFNSNNGSYSDSQVQFSGTTTVNGVEKQAAKGVSYRLLLRALKLTGDPRYEDQYESWLSPAFSYTK